VEEILYNAGQTGCGQNAGSGDSKVSGKETYSRTDVDVLKIEKLLNYIT
jgi:hypothetical protein